MTAALLLIVISASFLVVRIGAVALELTGMSWGQAKFQALSAFSNAGFTTRESELITSHPLRRRIATYLIILGNAGLVTAIGTFASSVVRQNLVESLLNLLVIAGGLMVVIALFRSPRLSGRLRDAIQRRLIDRYGMTETVGVEEILHLQEGYGLTRFEVPEGSPVCGEPLAKLQLKRYELSIIAIEREAEFIAVPVGADTIEAGDLLVVYGRRASVGEAFGLPSPTEGPVPDAAAA